MQFNEFCLAVRLYRLVIGWPIPSANENDIVIASFQKIGKKTRGRLELLTSIYHRIILTAYISNLTMHSI